MLVTITIETGRALTEEETDFLRQFLPSDNYPQHIELRQPTPEEPEVTDTATKAGGLDLEALRATAVAKATELLSSGQAAKVREALATAGGARKVSELEDDQLQAFVDAL